MLSSTSQNGNSNRRIHYQNTYGDNRFAFRCRVNFVFFPQLMQRDLLQQTKRNMKARINHPRPGAKKRLPLVARYRKLRITRGPVFRRIHFLLCKRWLLSPSCPRCCTHPVTSSQATRTPREQGPTISSRQPEPNHHHVANGLLYTEFASATTETPSQAKPRRRQDFFTFTSRARRSEMRP